MTNRRPKDTKEKAAKTRSGKKSQDEGQIVIDQKKGLIFDNENDLFEHFEKEISHLEKEFFKLRKSDDIKEDDFLKYEGNLSLLLDTPDEVWEDKEAIKGTTLAVYLKKIGKPRVKVNLDQHNENENDETLSSTEKPLYHVGIVYLADDSPTFVYLHFPTHDETLYSQYRRGEKIYDRFDETTPLGAIEGDALFENDEFARGLYQAMLKVRSETDFREDEFHGFSEHRESSIEQPDEIWRITDSTGNVLVHFIKDLSEDGPNPIFYIVVTIEDQASSSHALLFSFPTNDENLVARYRQGENLQAEEVVQEASH